MTQISDVHAQCRFVVLKVEHFTEALEAVGKKFECEIFKDIPEGHSFGHIDTKTAIETGDVREFRTSKTSKTTKGWDHCLFGL